MKQKNRIQCIMILFIFGITWLQGQEAVVSTGGTATGSGGSVTYTVGQVAYQAYSGTTGTVVQGVQQPYEISTPVAIAETEDISLLMNVYPNPTTGTFKLVVGTLENRNLRYRLYDLNGLLIKDQKVDSEETEIFLQDNSSSMYFLKIINNNQEIKVFKIVKQ